MSFPLPYLNPLFTTAFYRAGVYQCEAVFHLPGHPAKFKAVTELTGYAPGPSGRPFPSR